MLALFVASGFAGLIYQAIWSHYLGLHLGHAAYAQTLVLAIFMGGMAVGAWLVSRHGLRWRRLILAYALVEVAIGLAGLAFHPVFQAYTGLSRELVYPALGSEPAVRAWQWGTAALLIAPQSILLGMTFPLMSGGYLRVAPEADGEILGGLYFTNSIGAAFGALFATFVLLPWVGMPGTVAVAGAVNLAVGLLAWRVSRRADLRGAGPVRDRGEPEPGPAGGEQGGEAARFRGVVLMAAMITGASSFVYEIGWVRLLNQALGTTVHSFELMLSAFILGLAFGGLWIRRRSRRIGDPVAYAGYAQLLMGLAALGSIPVFSQSFRWVGALMDVLPRTEAGYSLFMLGSGAISLLVMFPAAFFAGMTLPLFTMALLRRGAGEASIGRIYAANTLGAILGVVLAVHVLVPVFGLRLAVSLAALADIALGLYLLRMFCPGVAPGRVAAAAAASVAVLAASLHFGRADPLALVSGVFRYGAPTLDAGTEVHYLRDGKTATVAFYTQGTVGIIATNGKPDASIQMLRGAPVAADEITMRMAGVLPLAIHPDPGEVAVIGWGSGLTTHVLLGSPAPRRVDSIEIERAMHEGARLFGSNVARAYADPRSRLHVDDARTYFSAGRRRFDVIISEPSNPWVSGVASLFTREFYGLLRGHLKPGGIAVQWIQAYEISDALLMTMVAAILEEFPHVEAYTPNGSDLLFVMAEQPLQEPDFSRMDGSALSQELAHAGLSGNADAQVRHLGGRDVLEALVLLYAATPHSDFFPTVSLEAPRARFMGLGVQSLPALWRPGLPVLELTGGRRPAGSDQPVTFLPSGVGAADHWYARWAAAALAEGEASPLRAHLPELARDIESLRAVSAGPVGAGAVDEWLTTALAASELTIAFLPARDLEGLWISPDWIDRAGQPPAIVAVLDAYDAAARRDGPAMWRRGLAALAVLGPDAPPPVREQMLVLAMLGAAAERDYVQVEAIERREGRGVPQSAAYGFVRAYLLAWADLQRRRQAGATAVTPSPAS